jgi:hypothetical protein
VDLPERRVRAAVDGDPVELEPPLASLPGGLRLHLPERTTQRPRRRPPMHDNPEATDDEQEEAHEGRQQEEESMRYPEHHDPDEQRERAHREREE